MKNLDPSYNHRPSGEKEEAVDGHHWGGGTQTISLA